MNDPNHNGPSCYGLRPDRPSDGDELSAPLGLLQNARLVFVSAAGQLGLGVSQTQHALYQARFAHPIPSVWLLDGALTIQHRHSPFLDRPVESGQPFAEIRLNGSIPWEIEFRNGVSRLKADLGRLQLRSLDLLGGAGYMELALSRPTATTFIYISGGLNQGVIRRPTGVGLRIRVSGGIRELVLDDRRLSEAGRETSLETPGFARATCRYDIFIAGGAGYVTIARDV